MLQSFLSWFQQKTAPTTQSLRQEAAAAGRELNAIQADLTEVESKLAATSAALVALGEREFDLRHDYMCLALELHDAMLHPALDPDPTLVVTDETRQRVAEIFAQRRQLEATMPPLLKGLEVRRGDLELAAFRLEIRVQQLKEEEANAQRTLRATVAEVGDSRQGRIRYVMDSMPERPTEGAAVAEDAAAESDADADVLQAFAPIAPSVVVSHE
jgi:septal ring factor EnvC (AmiA/AmiB activator)